MSTEKIDKTSKHNICLNEFNTFSPCLLFSFRRTISIALNRTQTTISRKNYRYKDAIKSDKTRNIVFAESIFPIHLLIYYTSIQNSH